MNTDKQNPCVLIVEDEIALSKVISFKLEKHGYDSVTARSVDQAIEYLGSIKNISVIWLDHYLLGKETGLDLLERVKNNSTYKDIPVFVVSNSSSPEKRQIYLQFGVDSFFIKADTTLDKMIQSIAKSLRIGGVHE
ncbi:response regulator [Candidatus Saccharibacteria bacterium]|nr:response regulator [Candidatus Saccharibacteria bacterium]